MNVLPTVVKYSILTILLLSCLHVAQAQDVVQHVKGRIIDQQSELPLIGATIQLISSNTSMAAVTDEEGNFAIYDIPIGRHAFEVSYLGFEQVIIPNVDVGAGKEVMLNIEMIESLVKLDEVTIVGTTDKDRSINDMATISTRQFSMEEVNRFSGGRSDVGRLAGNFAGVSTADDSRNDIVIRGNSPTGLLWRLEGIPIPSPNHFSTVGTTGGPVSALNTNFLKNSDFMTSAFPAEYGNAVSGVFDIGFRNGNKDKMEYMVQLGVVTGIEGMIEGPLLEENGGSFVVGYRYSFLGIALAAGLDVGSDATPNYSDLSFKLDFGKSSLGNFSLFGIYGVSDIEFLHDVVDESNLFAADDEDSRADSKFGVIGLKHNFLLDDKSYVRTVIAYSGNNMIFGRDRYYDQGTPEEVISPFVKVDDGLRRISLSSFYNKKHSSRLNTRAGFLMERVNVLMDHVSGEFGVDQDRDGIFDLLPVYSFDESTVTIQPYVQTQYRFNKQWTFNAGIHGMYYDLNRDVAVEPRVALNWAASQKHRFSVGYGLHHQSQPLPLQLVTSRDRDTTVNINLDLGFTRSHQFVLSHDFKLNASWRSKLEIYYQHLSNVPVAKDSTAFSVLNVGADFGFPTEIGALVNQGGGSNRGVELTIEKFFNQGFYLLATGSLFESKYIALDGIERNTAFNNQYVVNFLVGKEFNWGMQKRHRFTIDTKVTTAGGRYYTPVDLSASMVNEIEVFDDGRAFTEQYDNYFRWDIKIGCKLNSAKRKFSQSFYLDVQNVTNRQNIFRKSYNRVTNQVNDVFQLGFFPNLMYKIEF